MLYPISSVTDHTFKTNVLYSPLPVLVHFHSEWYGLCHALTSTLEEIAPDYVGKVALVEMEVDKNRVTSQQFQVRGVPTLMLFKDGQPQATHAACPTKAELIAFLDSHLPPLIYHVKKATTLPPIVMPAYLQAVNS